MGNLTVVMLSNDYAHEWEKDPKLGEKIAMAMNRKEAIGQYGQVVECEHADTRTLAILDGYTFFTPMAYTSWTQNQDITDMQIELLKEAANKLGFKLVRTRNKK